jgi:predicted Zn-dependent protease
VQQEIALAVEAPVLNLVVRRDFNRRQIEIHPVPACRSLFQIAPGAALEGEADGDYVQVSSAMAALAGNDDELAALLAHELAHNILGHRGRLDALHVNRGLFASFGRNARLIRATEQEADRLAVHLLARAGYDPIKALDFWVRVRAAAPGSEADPTHPSWPERLKAIRAEVRRIEEAGTPAGDVPLPADLAAALPAR